MQSIIHGGGGCVKRDGGEGGSCIHSLYTSRVICKQYDNMRKKTKKPLAKSLGINGYRGGSQGKFAIKAADNKDEYLKGLSHEIDFKSFDKNLQHLSKLRDAADFWSF